MNASDVRKAHKLLDYVSQGRAVLDDEIKLLRSFLPELPKQKTLEEIYEYVDDAWLEADGTESKEWLHELHAQLKGLKNTPAAVPALPDGMRIAEHVNFGRVVVSPGVGVDKCHEIFYLDPGMASGTDISEVEPDSLTFLSPKPARPEFLETEAGYDDAPFGTIVVGKNYYPWTKIQGSWLAYGAQPRNDFEMRACRRYVLRWGDK